MSDLVVIVPTKGRPASARRLYDSIKETSDADVAFAIDAKDPTIRDYDSDLPIWVVPNSARGMVAPLNFVAASILEGAPYRYVSFMGDDHLPRTPGWDAIFVEELARMQVGVVYGNDLLAGERIPTAVTMTANIPRTLGYMADPMLIHLMVDDWWADLGRGIGNLRYFPDVVIEHLHFLNGKAAMDATYAACNNPNSIADGKAYQLIKSSGRLDAQIASLRALLDE